MTLIRKWALAVCSAFLLTNYLATTNAQNITGSLSSGTLDPTQVYNTQNLTTFDPYGTTTTSPWQNVGQWGGQLECWAPGMPGYCGPNPYVNANGYGMINFSYGYTDLHQIVNIAAALPNSGTGLRVNGFNFGFTAKNGNGWDGGAQDYLVAYVNFYDSKNSLAQSYNYGAYTNQTYNWTTFNFSETFATPYAAKDLSTARYGFVGYDTNYWAGPYGPEIYGVNFSLKYSVDPCFVDVLSSPSCPGYLDAIAKLTPPITATVTTTMTTSTSTAPTTSLDVAQPSAITSTSTVTAPTVSVATISTSATPTATNPQPRVGEITISGSPVRTTVSTSQILAIVRAEQTRISAVETAAVQEAVSQAQQSAQAAVDTATQTVAGSTARSTSSIYSLSTGPVLVNSAAPVAAASSAAQNPVFQTKSAEILLKPAEVQQSTEGVKLTSPVAALNIVNSTASMPVQDTTENKGSSVNTKSQDNEAASGVSLSAMARQPLGFNAYNVAMPDASFYAPKEIYRNQRVVDNARAQRLLNGASDQLHQQMIEQQYK